MSQSIQELLTEDKPKLENDGEGDYLLVAPSVWITVGGLSVYILDRNGAVDVRIYKHYGEMNEELDSAWRAEAEDGSKE